MAYHSKNPRFETEILTDQGVSSISAPASGSHRLINRSGAIFVQNSSSVETQLLTGSAGYTYSAKSADYTVTTSDNILVVGMTTASTDRTVTLPAAASSTNRVITVVKVDSGTGKCIVDGNGSETINGQLTITLYQQYDSLTLVCNGTAWYATSNENFDNVIASQRGQKTYYHGTTYNGGNAPTVSGTSVTIDRAAFRPRQDQAGNWFVAGEISLTYSPSSASDTVTIAGITTISTNQPISVSAGSSNATKGYFNSSAGTLQWATVSGVANLIFIRFDVQCASKPNWVY